MGGRNREAIARQAVKDKVICSKVVEYLGKKVIAKEMKKMCTQSTDSVLRKRDPKSLEEFELGSVIEEMKEHAPSTLSLLRSCLAGCRRSEATDIKNKGRTQSRKVEPDRVVGVCCAILLRGRSQRMNLLQLMVSMILYCGHASKRVSSYSANVLIGFDQAIALLHRCIPGYRSYFFVCHTRQPFPSPTLWGRTMMLKCITGGKILSVRCMVLRYCSCYIKHLLLYS